MVGSRESIAPGAARQSRSEPKEPEMVRNEKSRPAVQPPTAPAAPAKAAVLKTPVDVAVLLMGEGSEEFVIHRVGCKSYRAQKARSRYANVADYILTGVVNQLEVIMEVWDDQIRETWESDEKSAEQDYADATYGWLARNGYVAATRFHTCLSGLPRQAKGAVRAQTETTRKAAKNELASLLAEAAGQMLARLLATSDESTSDDDSGYSHSRSIVTAGFASDDDIRQCVAQWLHGLPAVRSRFMAALPIPDRSDWRAELDEAAARAEARDTQDIPAETEEAAE